MPTYEYKCKKCGKEFEVQQRITEDPLTKCPDKNCGGEVFRKISKNVGLMFKGSGFYITDYTKNHGSSAGNTTHKNGDSKNGESKTEVKPTNGNAKKEVAKT